MENPELFDNEGLLVAFNEALAQFNDFNESDLSNIWAQLNAAGTDNVAAVRSAMAWCDFQTSACRSALRSRKINPRITKDTLVERWTVTARRIVESIAPMQLVELTARDIRQLPRFDGIDVFFAFLSAYKKDAVRRSSPQNAPA